VAATGVDQSTPCQRNTTRADDECPASVQTVRDATAAALRSTLGGTGIYSGRTSLSSGTTVERRSDDDGGHNESMRQAAVVAGHVGVELLQL